MAKAILLFSGGLDSTLALALLQRLGVEVVPLHFILPFWQEGKAVSLPPGLLQVQLGEEFWELVKHPKFGHGKNLNPCVDCHLNMIRRAKDLLPELSADFIATGEVLGQRPMSQHKPTLLRIEREAGAEGLVLRPLSAQLLDPTLPEIKGWVRREQLLGISGRSRKPQMELAAAWGITAYPSPGGGCLLTDPGYSRKLRDLMAADLLDAASSQWIRWGRYFSLTSGCKLMVARNESECGLLEAGLRAGDLRFTPLEVPGPTAVLRGACGESERTRAAAIVARYSDARGPTPIGVTHWPGPETLTLVPPALPAEALQAWHVG